MRWIIQKFEQRQGWRLWIRSISSHGTADSLEDVLQQPDPSAAYAILLRRYGNARSVADVQSIHSHLIRNGYGGNRFLSNTLLQAYAKCGSVENSRAVFERMTSRNAFSFSSMIDAYVQKGQFVEALDLYRRMGKEGVRPDGFVFSSLLAACSGMGDLAQGKAIHAEISATGVPSHIVVHNSLINMYIKCGSLEEARKVFDSMLRKDVVTWTTMIAAYTQNGYNCQALELYYRMEREGEKPDKFLFSSILGACSSLEEGRAIHARIGGLEIDVFVEIALVNMYARCGSVEEARKVFEAIQKKNAALAPWVTMISAYTQSGQPWKAIELFQKMDGLGILPDTATWAAVLGAYGSTGELDGARRIHEGISAIGFKADVVVETALINMYVKCGSIQDARRIFEEMQLKNVYSWSVMISAYSQLNENDPEAEEAMQLYQRMLVEGVHPNNFSFVAVLPSCRNVSEGKTIHSCIAARDKDYEHDLVLQTALMNMYARYGYVEEARKIFDRMPSRNVVSWTSMIAAYVQHDQAEQALELYHRMDAEPDALTYASVLGACAVSGKIEQGRQVHSRIENSKLAVDLVLENSLISMYSKCGSLSEARQVFDNMKKKDLAAVTTMVSAYSQLDQPKQVLEVFQKLQSDGLEPTGFIWSSIIKASAAVGYVHGWEEPAEKIFETMCGKNPVAWTGLIAGYVQRGQANKAIELFKRMVLRAEVQPDGVTYATVLGACCLGGALAEGRAIHEQIIRDQHVQLDVLVGTALVNMYAKCGNFSQAEALFSGMKEKNVVTWSALLAGYAQHGYNRKAVELCREMDLEGILPDGVTLISVLISCSHAGLIQEGWQYFHSIGADRGIEYLVEHFVCMVDLLGRAGWLEDALELIEEMPFQSTALAWRTLLSACKIHNNVKLAEFAARRALELEPKDSAAQVLLASIYSPTGFQERCSA